MTVLVVVTYIKAPATYNLSVSLSFALKIFQFRRKEKDALKDPVRQQLELYWEIGRFQI